ncbi:MAG: hypothetical protein KDD55_07260 [Bdellovibrionales bacterium]|nr:hypothetical protein [Bdellovibrionales bacterium]
MSNRFIAAVSFFVVFFSLSTPTVRAESIDLDGNGTADLLSVTIESDKSLSWSSYTLDTGVASASSIVSGDTFGTNGDILAPCRWLSSTALQLGTISRSGKKALWSVKGGSAQTFGNITDRSFVSGGDYDGDGICGAVRVRKNSEIIVKPNAFEGGEARSIGFFGLRNAKKAQDYFFLSRNGSTDEVALLRTRGRSLKRYELILKSLDGKTSTVTLQAAVRKSIKDVGPLLRANGTDALYIFTRLSADTRRLRVFNANTGAMLYSRDFNGAYENYVVVGDYLPNQPGEEIALVKSNSLTIVDPLGANDPQTVSRGGGSGEILTDLINNGRLGKKGVSTSPVEEPVDSTPTKGSCKGYGSVGGGVLYKPAADADGPRKNKPVALYTGSKKPTGSDVRIFSSNGVVIGRMGYKSSSIPGVNNGAKHYYSGWGNGTGETCSQLRTESKKNGGNGNIYIEGVGGRCLGPLEPCSRSGNI